MIDALEPNQDMGTEKSLTSKQTEFSKQKSKMNTVTLIFYNALGALGEAFRI